MSSAHTCGNTHTPPNHQYYTRARLPDAQTTSVCHGYVHMHARGPQSNSRRGTRATRARRSVPEHTHSTSSTDAQELTHACTHAHTHARAEATHNAMAPESPTAAGRGNTLAMGRVAARAASKGVRAKKTSSPPHTIHRHTRSNPCACMDRGHCKRYALHSCTCMRNRCTPVASAHRQREMRQREMRAARCDEQHYGECTLNWGGRATVGCSGARSHCCIYCPPGTWG